MLKFVRKNGAAAAGEMKMDSPPQIGNGELLLPEDIVEEILLLLPVKSLGRSKCVSKSWKSFIGSQHFIRKHLRNSTNNRGFPNHRVLMLQSTQRGRKVPNQYDLTSLVNNPSIDPSPMDDDPIYDGWDASIVGCCNGLVCILDEGSVFLWNPATKIYKNLPIILNGNGNEDQFITSSGKSGFGWDESSGDYKVFVTLHTPDHIRDSYQVYSSKANSWKTLGQGPSSFSTGRDWYRTTGTFAGGKIYWAESRGYDIVSFDLKSDEFGVMEPPCKPTEGLSSLCLGEMGGRLTALCDHRKSSLDVWVMKESWLKLATIPLTNQQQRPANCPITILLKGEILLLSGDTFLLHDPKFDNDNVFSALNNISCSHRVNVYVESLVSPPETETVSWRDWRWLLPHLTLFSKGLSFTLAQRIGVYLFRKYFD